MKSILIKLKFSIRADLQDKQVVARFRETSTILIRNILDGQVGNVNCKLKCKFIISKPHAALL